MRYSRASLLIGIFSATAALAGTAAADVAPPDDYVEQCTLALQQKAGEDCVECSATYFDDPNPCEVQYGALGYANRCSTWGTSHTEIWCKASNQGSAGSAGAADVEAAGQGGESSERPGPGSGGTLATGGSTATGGNANPAPTGGSPSTGGEPQTSTGGNDTAQPAATGGDSTTQASTGGSGTTETTSTGGASSPAGKEDGGGCSLVAGGSAPGSALPGLGIALALLGARRRARRGHD